MLMVAVDGAEFERTAVINLQWYLNSTRLAPNASNSSQLLLLSSSVQEFKTSKALARNERVIEKLWTDTPELRDRVTRVDRFYPSSQRKDQRMWNHFSNAVQFWDLQRLMPFVEQHLNRAEQDRWLREAPVECAQTVDFTRNCRLTDKINSSYGVNAYEMRGFYEWFLHCEYTTSSC